MTYALTPPPSWIPPTLLWVAAAAYVAFHYGFHADRWRRRGVDEAGAVHRQRLGGFLCLGAVPTAIALALGLTPEQLGLSLPRPLLALAVVAGVAAVALPLIQRSARAPRFREHHPQIRVAPPWDRRLRWENALSWALYLFAYELFFRGVLLFPLAAAYGAWPAIAITTLAYVWAHLPKPDVAETVGALPLGVVFAASALAGAGIWAPFAAHLLIALFAESRVTGPDPE